MVPKTLEESAAFFKVNVAGTQNLLKALEIKPPQQFVFISSVSVYGLETGQGITEEAALLGESPYAKSKIQAEQLIENWCSQRGVAYLILRLPLVVGPQPPGNLGAINRMIRKGYYFRISNNEPRKSMVLGEDVAQLIAAWNGEVSGTFNLTDGIHPRFCELEEALAALHGAKLRWSIPITVIKTVASLGDKLERMQIPFPITNERLKKMTNSLTFDDKKAREQLGWNPRPVLSCVNQIAEEKAIPEP